MRIAGTVLAMVFSIALGAQDLKQAENLYQHTDYDGALRVLQGVKSPDAATWALMGRSTFMRGDFRKATEYLQKAVALDPTSSDYVLWLGRSWGRRAETASPFMAPLNAAHARDCFEKAVALDPNNNDALSDLFDYYLDAPGFLGGGYDKAAALASRIQAIDPADGHFALAELARKKQSYGEAEAQLRSAIQIAPRAVGRVVELARLLAHQGRVQESDAVLEQADKIAPGSPRLLYERASIYVETNRKPDQARALLRKYLQSNLTPDDPPRQDAEKLLKRVQGA
jgi:tetratricopeptide (TPR) repeat protein